MNDELMYDVNVRIFIFSSSFKLLPNFKVLDGILTNVDIFYC